MGYAPKSAGTVTADSLSTNFVAVEPLDVPSRETLSALVSILPDVSASPNEMLVKDGVEFGGAPDIENDGTNFRALKLVVGGGATPVGATLKINEAGDKGFTIPVLTTAQRLAASMDEGSLVFDSDEAQLYFRLPASWKRINMGGFPPLGAGPATEGLLSYFDTTTEDFPTIESNASLSYDADTETLQLPGLEIRESPGIGSYNLANGRVYILMTLEQQAPSSIQTSVPREVEGDFHYNLVYASNNAITQVDSQFFRLNIPGTYSIKIRAEGYAPSGGGFTYDDLNINVYFERLGSGTKVTLVTPFKSTHYEGGGATEEYRPVYLSEVYVDRISASDLNSNFGAEYSHELPSSPTYDPNDQIIYRDVQLEFELLGPP
jgi:hypothetical protein